MEKQEIKVLSRSALHGLLLLASALTTALVCSSVLSTTQPNQQLYAAVDSPSATNQQAAETEGEERSLSKEQIILAHLLQADARNREATSAFLSETKPLKKANGKPSDEQLFKKQREDIKKELAGYQLHPSLGVKSVSELIPELGGRAVRNLVVTTWRSGSTFLGDVMQSHPATFYHYEPLLNLGIQQARSGALADTAVSNLKHLLYCNYTGIGDYLDYGVTHPWLLNHNRRLWWICFVFKDFCTRPDFLSSFCKLFPFQSVKVVRMRMNLTEQFLQDDKLAVRVLLMVRDPRGTMQSRRHRTWCPGQDDCANPQRLCEDLVSDYHSALDLMKRYPGRVRVVRYEDLSFNAYNLTRDLFNFFRLSYVRQVDDFLQSHTKRTKGGVSSTFRDSKVAPVHWKTDLTFQEVEEIQSKCHRALELFRYRVANNADHLTAFDPIADFNMPVT